MFTAWCVLSVVSAWQSDAVSKAVRDLDSPTAKVRLAALDRIEKVSPSLYRPLREYLLADSDTIPARLAALADVGESARPVIPLLRKHCATAAESKAHLVTAYSKALRALKADDAATADRMKAIAESRAGAEAREAAIDYLVWWAGEDARRRKDVIPVLALGLLTKPLTEQCLRIAGDWGADARPLLPVVRKLRLSEDARVRELADLAVGKIEKK